MIIRKLEALFTINTNAIQFKRATDQLEQFSHKVEKVMKGIASYWAVDALRNFMINTANAMDDIGKNAKFIGITTDALQELRYAAEKSGLSIDGLEDALKELQIRAVDSLSGVGEAFASFDKLGVKPTDAVGKIKEPLDLLIEVADKLKELSSDTDRLWVADAIFGDEGYKMRMMLYDGAAGLIKLREEARSLGLVISSEGIKKAFQFNEALVKMRLVAKASNNAVIETAMGPLSWLMEKLSKLCLAFNQLDSRVALVRIGLTTLAGVVTAIGIKASMALAPLMAPFLPLIGSIIAASIVLEDLWVAFMGGDSVIGSIFQGISKFVQEAAWAMSKDFSEAFASIYKEFAKFSDWLSAGLAALVKKVNNFISGLVPDFFKKDGFLARIKHVLPMPDTQYDHHQLNTRLAPTTHNISNQRQLTQNQKVSVNVNVKSGAHPHDIGSEVAKAVRHELEKERVNAFMGIYNYAG